MNFSNWFIQQHGKRPSDKDIDHLLCERNELQSIADNASRLVDACEMWEAKRTSALWAWNAAGGGEQ